MPKQHKKTHKKRKKKTNTQSIKNIIKIYYEIFNAKIMLMFLFLVGCGNEVVYGWWWLKKGFGLILYWKYEMKIHHHQMKIELENGID